uniref:Uncharacterized protein n=1 Tax=Glossina morsitans morsitans TaxID=37546 RepID=A0A1B0G706_GLOMM
MEGPPPGPPLGEPQTYCLRWNLHQSNLVDILDVLYKRENYVDCTIIVDDNEKFKAHRVVLAANSPYFHSILQDVPGEHCSIIFPGVKKYEMEALLEYMYTGEVDVTQSLIPRIMRIAEELKVKGLFDMADLKEKFSKASGECNERAADRCTRPISPDVLYRSPASTSSNCAQIPRITKDTDSLDHHETSLISTSSNISPSSTQNFGLIASTPGGQWTMSPSSAAAAMINSVYDAGNDISSLKHAAEMSAFPHIVNGEDTPILRNVLGHTNPADSSQSLPLVLPSTSASAAATAASTKGDVSSSAHMVGQSSHGFSLNGSDYSGNRVSASMIIYMKFFNKVLRNLKNLMQQPDRHSQLPQQQHDEQHSPMTDRSFDDEGTFANRSSSSSYDSNVNSAQTGNQKPEWKRYKQYTRNDIMSAIQCVKQGMTALQASKKFGVPSRTLYDKVKKLGITTGRPINRSLKRSPTNMESSAAFPYAHTYGQASTSVAMAAAAAMHDVNRENSELKELKEQLQRPSEPHHLPQAMSHPTLLDRAFLQQALESRGGGDIAGREALHAMALAAVAQAAANHISTNPGANGNAARSPSPATFPLIKYCNAMHIDEHEGLERTGSGNSLERHQQIMEIDDDNRAQDLTINRKTIKSPLAVEQREQRPLSTNILPTMSQPRSSHEAERTVIINSKLPLNLSDEFIPESAMKREVVDDVRGD